MKLTVGSLFAGIGGFDLGLERAGLEVKWQVEIDPYCRSQLARHWPDVPQYEDVHDVGLQQLGRVDVLCGGFPCQPVSVAGKGAAQDDDRWLWPEFARLIREIEPRYVLAENVPGLRGRGLEDVLTDLSLLGYDAEWHTIPAAAFGAPHFRQRVWIVAYRRGERLEGECEMGAEGGPVGRVGGEHSRVDPVPVMRGLSLHDALAFPHIGVSLFCHRRKRDRELSYGPLFGSGVWEPFTGSIRVVDGVPNRVDRVKAYGNAVLPQAAEWLGKCILEHAAER